MAGTLPLLFLGLVKYAGTNSKPLISNNNFSVIISSVSSVDTNFTVMGLWRSGNFPSNAYNSLRRASLLTGDIPVFVFEFIELLSIEAVRWLAQLYVIKTTTAKSNDCFSDLLFIDEFFIKSIS